MDLKQISEEGHAGSDATAKNNCKYNNCTLECNKLILHVVIAKIKTLKRLFYEVSRLERRKNKNFLGICFMFSFMKKHSLLSVHRV